MYDEASINVILDQAHRIGRLTDDLQEIVDVEAGKIDLERTTIDLRELVTNAADRLRIQQTTNRVRVITAVEPVAGVVGLGPVRPDSGQLARKRGQVCG